MTGDARLRPAPHCSAAAATPRSHGARHVKFTSNVSRRVYVRRVTPGSRRTCHTTFTPGSCSTRHLAAASRPHDGVRHALRPGSQRARCIASGSVLRGMRRAPCASNNRSLSFAQLKIALGPEPKPWTSTIDDPIFRAGSWVGRRKRL